MPDAETSHPSPVRRSRRRFLLPAGVAVLILLGAGLAGRLALARWAVLSLLRLEGASAVSLTVTRASPWLVELRDVSLQVRTQSFSAKQVTIARAHWWSPTLGVLRVEQARMPWAIDGSDTQALSWATYENGQVAVEPMQLPLEEISIQGQLVLEAAALAEQTLTVSLEARRTGSDAWEGRVQAEGPGLTLQGEGRYVAAKNEFTFKLPVASLEMKTWQNHLQRLVLLPGGTWELAGVLSGQAEGRLAGNKLTASATVRLREGRLRYAQRDITAEGVEFDLDFTDLAGLVTKPGALRIRELRSGRLVLRSGAADFALAGADQFAVSRATVLVLGGTVTAEPFNYFPRQRELEVVVRAEELKLEEIMALTKDLPAQATGRVSGRLPVRIDDGGVRLGTGWLQLAPGVRAEIQFNAHGFLTHGLDVKSPTYAVLNRIESGLLKLRITEMRLDIRPPGAPPGRSAQLHLAGEPVDQSLKAPVVLDLNVNGPLERLIDLGIDSRVSLGTKP